MRVLRGNARVFSTLGVAVALTAAVRQARLVALPLWAAHIGLADSTTSAVFAVSAAVDMVLFLPAGLVMDQRGRTWTAIPSTLVLSVGLWPLPLTTGLATLSVAAVMLGVGNGWGSGLVMTLGSDVAPRRVEQVFIGLWMVFQDVGGLVGPAIVSLGGDRVARGGRRLGGGGRRRRDRFAAPVDPAVAPARRGGPLAAYQFAKFWTTYHPLELCAMPIPTWWKVVRRMLSLWWGEFIKAVSARLARPSFGHPLIQ